jgi:hypothetical protein
MLIFRGLPALSWTRFFLRVRFGMPMLQMYAFGLLIWCHANNKKF